MRKIVVFTDMDGTLLDHHSYSHQAADELLATLAANNIPVIPTTSKTYAELLPLRTSLANNQPFIVENGAAIYLPKHQFAERPNDVDDRGDFWLKRFVEPRSHWQQLLHSLDPKYGALFLTYTAMGVEGISETTGLSLEQAKLSADRQFGEPVQWLGDEAQLQEFCGAVEQAGGNTLVGGRFVHVSGHVDKGAAVQWLVDTYRVATQQEIISIGLGDSGNDVAMLAAVDYPIIVRSPVHRPPLVPEPRKAKTIITTQLTGPQGWVEGVSQVLATIDNT